MNFISPYWQAGKKGALIKRTPTKENKNIGTGSLLCRWEGLEEVVNNPQWEGQRPYTPLPPLAPIGITALAFAAPGLQARGQEEQSGLPSGGFFHSLKELKRNMGCLEAAVISQERDKGNMQFASRLPNPGNQRGASDPEQNFCPETKIVRMAYMSLCCRTLHTVGLGETANICKVQPPNTSNAKYRLSYCKDDYKLWI